jgi:hypothetical protein
MGKVIQDITMSLVGFIAGKEISNSQPMGKYGNRFPVISRIVQSPKLVIRSPKFINILQIPGKF